jgi:predicted RNA-binding Zn-ribbon protein involved in translation (DUF1610 family)
MPEGTMKDGLCPRCGAREVHTNAGNRWMRNRYDMLLVTAFRWAYLADYVCVKCGFVERYTRDPKDLANIAERWPRVGAG